MPYARLDLGKFVSVRGPRADGTYRVLFEVPARLRPSGWPSTRPLPTEGRTGDLSDAAEVARIQTDAARLYAEMQGARSPSVVTPQTRTIDTLIKTWRATQRYKALKPRTQRGYDHVCTYIEAWSESLKHPDPTALTKPQVEAFLATQDDHPTTRRMIKVVLKMIMDQAIDLGWRADNPVSRIKMGAPKSRVTIWEQADVDAYVVAARKIGQPDMAALILMEWEIGQRLTDAYLFRVGEQYKPAEGVFSFEQSKTEANVTIPVSDRLRAVLDGILTPERLYLFHDARTGRPWARMFGSRVEADDTAASKVFALVRASVVASGGRHLQLKVLRHSCIVQQARAGCTVPEIASITGHSIASVEQILQRYLPRDSQVARNAQEKRGLVSKRDAG